MGMKPICRLCKHGHWSYEAHIWTDGRVEADTGRKDRQPASKPKAEVTTPKPLPGEPKVLALEGKMAAEADSAEHQVSPPGGLGLSVGKMTTTRDKGKFNAYMKRWRKEHPEYYTIEARLARRLRKKGEVPKA